MIKLIAILIFLVTTSSAMAQIGSRVHCDSKDGIVTIDIDSDARTLAVNYGDTLKSPMPATVINYGIKLYANSYTGFVVTVFEHANYIYGKLTVNSGDPTPLICQNF